jgi:hypothetical protein
MEAASPICEPSGRALWGVKPFAPWYLRMWKTRVRIMGVGVSAFVSHDFLVELKTPPFFWAGPELAKRVLRGESPLLSDKQDDKLTLTAG